jgi:hypothetical protein
MFKYLFVALLVVAAPQLASANGGGNSKANATVRVNNKSTSLVALVALNPSDSLKASTSLSQFTSRGGKVINPGGRFDFKNVKAGNQQLVYALVESDAESVNINDFSPLTVKTTSGKRTDVNLPPSSSNGSSSN